MNQWKPPPIVAQHLPGTSPQIEQTFNQLQCKAKVHASAPVGNAYWQLTQLDVENPQSSVGMLGLIRDDGVKFCVDFTQGKTRHRFHEAGHGARQLKKALGLNTISARQTQTGTDASQSQVHIVDATGGWGQDAWAIASVGCQVTVFESNAIVHALLNNALQRAQSSPLYQQNATRISLIAGNASEAMEETAKERQQSEDSCHESLTESLRNSMQSAHAIYLDPMYPSRKKRAEVSKGMQMLHRLVGPADPAQSHRLLAAALNLQVARVVVKRPRSSSVLEGTERWSGQRTDIVYPNTRYDIYHKN